MTRVALSRLGGRHLVASGLGVVLVGGLLLLLGATGALFSSLSGSSAALGAGTVEAFVPTAVTASRLSGTTCQVSWTPATGTPSGVTYDVTDGASTTLATGVAGTSVTVTIGSTQVVPTVRARAATWLSTTQATAATPGCIGIPGAPTGVTTTPSDAAVAVSWTAPSSNGGSAVTGYTVTAVPAESGLVTRTCTATAPGTSCTVTGLTDGASYTITVTAANVVGSGPASSAVTAVPYPDSIMTAARLKLWLDGADSTTLYASSTCSGAAATTAVGCWKDKSTSANHVSQAVAGSRPTLASVKGHSVPAFDGSSQHLVGSPTLLPTATTSSTVAAAGAVDPSVAMNGIAILSHGGTTNGSQRRLTSWVQAGVDVSGAPTAFASAWPGSQAQGVVVGEFASGSSVSVWAQGDSGATTAGAFSTGTDHFWLGAGGTTAPSGRWKGNVTEIIVFTGTLTATERRTVQEYLARKWGSVITPSAPTGVTATEGDGTASPSWTVPWDGGSSVTSATVTAVPVDGSATRTCTATAPATSCTLTGLTNGVRYTVTVIANNAIGASPASAPITVVARPALMASASAKLWLDAASSDTLFTDAAGTTLGSVGSGVGRWNDRSGHGLHAWVADGIGKPVLTASALNGYPALRFDRTHPDWMQITATGIGALGSADRSLFVVGGARTTQDNAENSYAGFLIWPGQHAGLAAQGYPSATTLEAPAWSSTGYVGASAAMTFPGVLGNVGSGTAGVLTTTAYGNGKVLATGTSAASSTWRSYPDLARIGAGHVAPDTTWLHLLDGDIGEILGFDRALTSAERRTVEEYLARKWSVTITPAAPTSVTATPGNTQASVSWTAPWTGGSAITSYTATAAPGGRTCSATPPATSCTITSLTNGTTYTVSITATNAVGTGPAGTASVTPNVAPGAPTGVTATASTTTSGTAQVTWTAPAANGGTAITSYTATAVPGVSGLSNVTCTASASPCTLSGLADGVTYTVSVAATNAAGTGASSTSTTVMTYPASLMTSSAMRLWLDGASTTTMFTNTACSTAATSGSSIACWADRSGQGNHLIQNGGSSKPTLSTFGGRLVPTFDGNNDVLDRTSSTLPTGTAASTTFVVATSAVANPATDGQRSLLFWGTSGTAGAGRFVYKPNTSAAAATSAEATTAAADGSYTQNAPLITVSTFGSGSYGVRAQGRPQVSQSVAFNTTGTAMTLGFGSTPWSGPVQEIVVVNSALTATDTRSIEEYLARKWSSTITPAAPASVAATAGSGSATVSFTAPAWNGGASVTSYTVAPTSGAGTCTWSSGTTATCTGLTVGQSYTFTVRATNSIGAGPTRTTNAVTP